MDFFKNIFINEDIKMSKSDWCVDLIVMLGIFGLMLLQLTASANILIPDAFIRRMLGVNEVTPSSFGAAACFLTCLPLLFRRRYSWISLILTTFIWFIFDLYIGDAALSILPPLVALATLSWARSTPEAIAGGCFLLLIVVLTPFFSRPTTLTTLTFLQNFAFVVAVAGFGISFHTTKELIKSAELRAEKAEEASRAEAERKVEEERVAIARELHDITAHSLSAITIQAAAAEAQLDKDVDAARSSIQNIRKTSKDSLNEIRNMIGVLRDEKKDDVGASLTPTLDTTSMNDLATYLENAGIKCKVNMNNYSFTQVPKYVDIAIFGIAREATTNIVKHSRAKNAEISLDITDIKLTNDKYDERCEKCAKLIVKDDGKGIKKSWKKTAGHGVEGMRERVETLSGKLSLTNVEPSGCCITVLIPLNAKTPEN